MKAEAIKAYYILNGEIKTTLETEIFNKIEKPPIYEVLRVINSVPLFLEDHLKRMFDSANLIGHELPRESPEIKNDIKKLIEKNKIDNLNIKLISADINSEKVFLVYNIESFYPPQEYYIEGIHTTLFEHERDNPNAKVLFSTFKENVAKKIKEAEAFEALLVSKSGYIPEGSRSNMFFVKGDKVYTAKASDVLVGITRNHIFNVCSKLNIQIIEESIHVDDLEKLDGAFMSGTSVNVLPIKSIDNIKLNSISNPIIKAINHGYINEIKEYIEKNH